MEPNSMNWMHSSTMETSPQDYPFSIIVFICLCSFCKVFIKYSISQSMWFHLCIPRALLVAKRRGNCRDIVYMALAVLMLPAVRYKVPPFLRESVDLQPYDFFMTPPIQNKHQRGADRTVHTAWLYTVRAGQEPSGHSCLGKSYVSMIRRVTVE